MSISTNKQISSNIVGLRFAEETSLGLVREEDPNAPGSSTASNGQITFGGSVPNAEFSVNSASWDAANEELTVNFTGAIGESEANIDIRNGATGNLGEFASFNDPPTDGIWVPPNGTVTDPAGYTMRVVAVTSIPSTSTLEIVFDLAGSGLGDGDTIDIRISDNNLFSSFATAEVLFNSYGATPSVTVGHTVWYPADPNEFDDFGGEIQTIARSPISRTRQRRKGVAVDVDSSGGWEQDLVQLGNERLWQGFFFSDAIERPTTHSVSGINTITIDSVDDDSIDVQQDLTGEVFAGSIVKLSGFDNAANNGVFTVGAVNVAGGSTSLDINGVVSETLSDTQQIDLVGHTTGGQVDLTIGGGVIALDTTSGTVNWNSIGFTVGEWIALEDISGDQYGFARVVKIEDQKLSLDQPTWDVSATSQTTPIKIYFGRIFRNAVDPDDVKCRSFQLERTLGEDEAGTQSEYLKGQIPNSLTLKVEAVDKVMTEMSFVGTDVEHRTGTQGLKLGDRPALIEQDAYNTSSHVEQMRLYVHDDTTALPDALFGYVSEAEVVINNNAEGLKAIGTFGSFDVNVGDFEVDGELEVYFASVEAMKAVRCNKDVGFNILAVRDNAGWVLDVPLVSLGGGRAEVEKGNSIMLPLEIQGAQNKWGYTALSTWFCYLSDKFHVDTDC